MHRRFPNIDNMGYEDRLTQPDAPFAYGAVGEQGTYYIYIRCRQYAPQSAPQAHSSTPSAKTKASTGTIKRK